MSRFDASFSTCFWSAGVAVSFTSNAIEELKIKSISLPFFKE
jgi:hypothetical protein